MTKNLFLKQNNSCYFVFCFVLFCVCFALLFSAKAAELNLSAPAKEVGIGQQFQVDLILDTEGESINALEGKIIFPADRLELREIRDGNSIINFWVERPRDQNGAIIFSGITPGGFNGESGLILALTFQAKKGGEGKIELLETRALKNDGAGSPVNISTQSLNFRVKEESLPLEEAIVVKVRDYEPPESFIPEVARDESMFDNKWFLVFATQDKSSGIDHYEVKEQRKMRILGWPAPLRDARPGEFGLWKKWKQAESPYVLADQELKSYIFVKAIDKDGNERVAVRPPQKSLSWYENYLIYVIIIIVISAIIAYKIWRNLRRKTHTKIH